MRGFAFLLIAVCWMLPAASALADIGDGATGRIAPRATEPMAPRKIGTSKGGATSAGWTTVAGALAVVVVLILALAKVARQRGLLAPADLPREAVDVLGRKLIDYRNTVHLVRCGSRLLVLASSQAGLTTLAEITDADEVDSLTALCKSSEPAALTESFGELMRRFRSEPAEAKPMDRETDPTILRLKERLATVRLANDETPDRDSIREETG